jgi:predicted HTH transcriptional regulator
MKSTKALLEFWEEQMKQSHTSSNFFFRKSPSHYHMMLIIMAYYKQNMPITVEELKTKLFKTSRPKSALIITKLVKKVFFIYKKQQRIKEKKISSQLKVL